MPKIANEMSVASSSILAQSILVSFIRFVPEQVRLWGHWTLVEPDLLPS
jgi:hypothetical protein